MILQWSPANGQSYFYAGTWARHWLTGSWLASRGARLCASVGIFLRLDAAAGIGKKILQGIC